MRPRFSLAALMVIVVVAGVGFAAMRSSTTLWASEIFTLTLGMLLVGAFGAMAHRGRTRLTWAGFALFGWAYLLAVFGPWADPNGATVPPLLTTRLLQQIGPQVLGSQWGASAGYMGETDVVIAGVTVRSPRHFPGIGHCFSALVFGLIGDGVGRTFAPRSDIP
jgi:hypothetical protein